MKTKRATSVYTWYLGYGSNLDDDRFLSYIRGGTPSGVNRRHGGARNAAPPIASINCVAPGTINFRGFFEVWGSGGGAAFYSPPTTDNQFIYCRAHCIDVTQLTDVVLQENGISPPAHLEGSLSLDRALVELVENRGRCSTSPQAPFAFDLTPWVGGPYDILSHVSAVSLHGGHEPAPAFLITSGTMLEATRPPREYVDVIVGALRTKFKLSKRQSQEYIQNAMHE